MKLDVDLFSVSNNLSLTCSLNYGPYRKIILLGPMVYGISYCVKSNDDTLKKLGCADSKSLTEEKREDIFTRLCGETEHCGWAVDIISPMHISNCMLRR